MSKITKTTLPFAALLYISKIRLGGTYMKKIYMGLLLVLIPTVAFSYVITNSPASMSDASVGVYNKKPPLSLGTKKAHYNLSPGENGAWNKNEIQKKLKVQDLFVEVVMASGIDQAPMFFDIENMPLDVDLEILIRKLGDQFIGGAINHNTGKIYNEIDFKEAYEMIKKYNPQQLQRISATMSKYNIK